MLSSVDFPLPEAPSNAKARPSHQSEVDAVQRAHVDLAHAVGLTQVRAAQDFGKRAHGAPLLQDGCRARPSRNSVARRSARHFSVPGRRGPGAEAAPTISSAAIIAPPD